MWLAGLGCTVTECPDGRSGLQAVAARGEKPVDLVLLDVLLPDLDGRDLYRRLRRLGDAPVLVTSVMAEGVAPLAERDAVLPKPFRRRELEQAVRRMITLPPPARRGAA